MHAIRVLGLGLITVALMTAPAAANEPPRPQLLVAETLLLPLMILLSVAGGAYAILQALRPPRKGRIILKAAAAVLAILASGMTSGIAVLVAGAFGALALQRAVQMVRWGLRARSRDARPVHLAQARPSRLLAAGIILFLLSTALMGMALAFMLYWPPDEAARRQAFEEAVALQIAAGRQAPASPGAARPTPCPVRLPAGLRLETSPDGTDFTLLMGPKAAFPFFPYNYLTAQPSYRADATGAIRMIEVHDRDTVCPPDAPVVARVSEIQIARMTERLNGSNCP